MKSSSSEQTRSHDRSIGIRISATYMLIGGLWIVLSDTVAGSFTNDPETLAHTAMIKGMLYVLLTGAVLYLLIGRGISTIRKSEQALRESEEKYRVIFENMSDVFYRTDLQGKIALVSPSVAVMFGYTPEEALGMSLTEAVYVDPGQRKALVAALEEKGEVKGFEVLLKRKDGSHIWVATDSRLCKDCEGNALGVEGIIRDVTEYKLAEARLEQANDYLENILENSPDPIGIVDRHGRFIRWNRSAAELFGYSIEEISDRTAFDLYASSSDREAVLAELRRSGVVRAHEVPMRRADGATFPVELSIGLLTDGAGSTIGSVTIARDLSEIKKTNEKLMKEIAQRERIEKALRESENIYRTIFENTGTATVIIEEDTGLSLVNAEFENLSGHSKEELEGLKSWTEFVDPADLQAMAEYHRRRRMDDPAGAPRKYEFRFIDRHGSQRTVLSTVAVIPGTKKTVASLVDVTEQKKLEAELTRADKLESVGILAGGIAHDFNNILAAIMGNISLAKMHAKPEERLYYRLEEAEKAAVRAKDLTYQLLTFSKGGAPTKKPTSVFDVVQEAAGFALRGSNVTCGIDQDEGLRLVEADTGQISQVINNMVINAKQAMPTGGVINISLRNVRIAGTCDLPLDPGEYVRVSIRDQGAGIPKEHLQKIFDPYFTTKQTGSGLGLATSYSIVSKHNGHIAVESRLGAGTTFHIYLPATRKKPEPVAKAGLGSIFGRGKILLMDDEEVLRRMAAQMLSLLGYKTASAKDGQEAIELFRKAREEAEPFDAVILDLTIPGGMGGAETVVRLLDMDPTLKAVASSGYSNDPVMADFEKYGFKGVLAKPYVIEELGKVLQGVIKSN